VAPRQEGAHRDELLGGHPGDVPSAVRLLPLAVVAGGRPWGRRRRRWGCDPLADDDRARGKVADALIASGRENGDRPQRVAGGRAVENPDEIAYGTDRKGHRAPVGLDDTQSTPALGRRAPPGEDLEEDVIAHGDREGDDGQDGKGELAAHGECDQRRGADDDQLEQTVDKGRDEARSVAGEEKVDRHAFGRLDRQEVLILHRAVNLVFRPVSCCAIGLRGRPRVQELVGRSTKAF